MTIQSDVNEGNRQTIYGHPFLWSAKDDSMAEKRGGMKSTVKG